MTVRSDDAKIREELLDGIDRVTAGVVASLGVPEDRMPEVIRSPAPFFKVEPEPGIKSGIEASVIAAMALFGE